MLLLWLQEKKQQNQSHAHITLPTPFPLDYTPRKCMRGECKEVGTRQDVGKLVGEGDYDQW